MAETPSPKASVKPDPAKSVAGEQGNSVDISQFGMTPELVNSFSEQTFRYSGRGYRDRLFQYRLFIPPSLDRTKKYPLLVWLHGYGDGGDNNVANLKYMDRLLRNPKYDHRKRPFFVLSVSCPSDNPYWTTSASDADDMLNVVMAILEKTLETFPIDADRVSVAGVSSGGTGCWELAMRHPGRFSAIAPLGSPGGDLTRAKLITTPIWAFHCNRDTYVPPEGDRKMVAALEAAGVAVEYTETDSPAHDCWTEAFMRYDLLDWLLSTRRGTLSTGLAGLWHSVRSEWMWWQILLPVGVLVLFLMAIWSVVGSRRKRKLFRTAQSKDREHNTLDQMPFLRHSKDS